MKFGLSNDIGLSSKNLSIIQGTFRLQVPEGTIGAVKRIKKTGGEVSELSFSSLTGYIKNISFEDTEKYGRRTHIVIESDKDYKLSLGYADGLACNIYKILPNVDPSLPVRINLATEIKPDGKNRVSLFINQNDRACKWNYTKDNPNGMPSMKQIKVKGQDTWDNTDQVEFLLSNAVNPFIEKLSTVVRGDTSPTEDDGTVDFFDDNFDGMDSLHAEGPETVDIKQVANSMPKYNESADKALLEEIPF